MRAWRTDFRAIRKALDDFNPDLVLIWGDDQYENFREDIIPAFCVFGLDEQFAAEAMAQRQWRQAQSLGRARRLDDEAARRARRGEASGNAR